VSTTQEALELVHHHPGRLRVRANVLRDQDSLAALVRDAVLPLPGVTRVVHSPRTGSLLIEYQPGHGEPDRILATVATAAGVCPCPDDSLARSRTPAVIAVGAAQELNAITDELFGHKADLRTLIPAGLAALSAYSFVVSKDARLPRWDNLLWWSYSIFVSHHEDEIMSLAEERRLARLESHTPGRADAASGEPAPTT
jgi:hypothetical protein